MSTTAAALRGVATGQSTPDQARDPYERLKQQMERSKAEFLPLFGQSVANVDAFVRIVLNAVLANPDLLSADRRSLMTACMKAAQDGLVPDGREAVLNIYSTNTAKRGQPDNWVQLVQYLPMVGGLVKLMYATGDVVSVDAAAVFANDRFLFRRGDDPKLEHIPTLEDEPGGIIAAYCVVKMKSGEIKREVMPWRDIALVRAASKSGENANSPWVKWLDQMAIKSVIKRIYKQLPRNDRFEKGERSDNEALGFAATPESIGEMTARPALGFGDPDTLDMHIPAQTREGVPVHQGDAGQQSGQAVASLLPEYLDKLAAAKKADGCAIFMDEARDMLNPADLAQLTAAYSAKFPG